MADANEILACFMEMAERGVLRAIDDIVRSSLRAAQREGLDFSEDEFRCLALRRYNGLIDECIKTALNYEASGNAELALSNRSRAEKYAKLCRIDISGL